MSSEPVVGTPMRGMRVTEANWSSSSSGPICLLVMVCLLGAASVVYGAQPSEDAVATIKIGAATGTRRYRPGAWGVVEVRASNPTDEAVELRAAGYFSGNPTFQYGRTVWVPSRATLTSTCPVGIPASREPGASHVSFVPVPVDQPGGADSRGYSPAQAIEGARPLIVSDDPVAVCILGDFGPSEDPYSGLPFHLGIVQSPPGPDDCVYEMLLAGRAAEGLSRRVSTLNPRDLPADPAVLDAFDVLVLCSNHPAEDPDAVSLVRNWVLRGGCLWISLDDMEQEAVSVILGDAFTSSVVDRVNLTELQFENAQTGKPIREETGIEFDDPVRFTRVVPGDVTVTDTVNGWPAAFWQPYGEGRVFYTTVGPRAWYRPVMPGDPKPRSQKDQIPYFVREPLARLAKECFSDQSDKSVDVSTAEPFLAKQIGYRIMGRQEVAGILTAFCGVLIVVGTWFWRTGRLDRLLWICPSLALGTSLVFLLVATAGRNSVPATVAQWQRIVLEPGVATGNACGLISLYNPKTSDSQMGATRGGLFLPDMAAMQGEQRRIMWTDEHVWHWEGLDLPPGIRTAAMEKVVCFDETVDCCASFGPSGLVGTLDASPLTGFSDAVIVVPGQPALATKFQSGGAFSARPEDVLASGEFLADTWLSDVQQRRADLFRNLMTGRSKDHVASRPVLYVWSDPLDTGFIFPQPNRIGSALLSIPIQFERPIRGSMVTVPASFISFRGIIGPDGNRPSAYSAIVHEWCEMSSGATDWLRFQLPESVLPLELSRAVVSLDIRAPSRFVEILGLNDGAPVVVKQLSLPIGTYQISLDRPGLLQLDEHGGLTIALRVGAEEVDDPQDLMAQANWKVHSLQMSVVGKVQGD